MHVPVVLGSRAISKCSSHVLTVLPVAMNTVDASQPRCSIYDCAHKFSALGAWSSPCFVVGYADRDMTCFASDQARRQREDEEEERIREIVFGKGSAALLSSFGAEGAGAKPQRSVDHEDDAVNGGGFVIDTDGDRRGETDAATVWVDEDDAELKVHHNTTGEARC